MYIQKTISAVVSTLLCFSFFSQSVSAVEASYIKGDIDGNGVVNALDLVKLVSFLCGRVTADGETAERLDVNRDFIIDDYDKSFLSSILLGDEDACDMESTNINSLPAQEAVKYRVFDYEESEEMYTYTLYPLSNIDVPSRIIIGNDDRYPEDSLECVINVRTPYNSNTGQDYNLGTAFILDSHIIMTAAHVLYDNDGGPINVNANPHLESGLQFKIYSDHDTQDSTKVITPIEYHIPDKYIYTDSNREDHWKYDYAIVYVEEDLSDYVDFEFKLGIMRSGMTNTRKIYVTGFSGDDNGSEQVLEENINVKTTGWGYLTGIDHSFDNWNYALYYNTDGVAGDSGAPAYVYDLNGNKTVIAINNYAGDNFNQGTRITPNILHFAYNNPYL